MYIVFLHRELNSSDVISKMLSAAPKIGATAAHLQLFDSYWAIQQYLFIRVTLAADMDMSKMVTALGGAAAAAAGVAAKLPGAGLDAMTAGMKALSTGEGHFFDETVTVSATLAARAAGSRKSKV